MLKKGILVIVAVIGVVLYFYGMNGVPYQPLLDVMFVGVFFFSVPIFIAGFQLLKKRRSVAFIVIILAGISLYLGCKFILIIAFSR